MAASEKDERPTSLEERVYRGKKSRAFTTWTRNVARTFPMNSKHGKESLHYISPLRRRPSRGNTNNFLYVNSNNDIVFQPPQSLSDEGDSRYAGNSRLSESGHLGMCDDPYCMACPTHIKSPQGQPRQSDTDAKTHHVTDGGAKGRKNIFCSSYNPCIPRVMNPHSKYIRKWNKFIIISCLISIFIDPLFFFLLYANEDNKCIVLNWTMTKTIVVLRSLTDFIYFLHILLQFRLAYIAPESRVVGAGDLVDDPKKIALHYLSGNFILDIFVALPLPQAIILIILPATMGATGANYAKNVLRIAILVQYIPRLYRFLPMLVGLSPNGLILESAWANFIMNLLTFMLASHVVGSCWYLFGLQRLNQCLRDACHSSNVTGCTRFIDCGHVKDYLGFKNDPMWNQWRKNKDASGCFDQSNFAYGIYQNAINLTTRPNIILRYVYSLFWGFQQISTLAGNQVPSYFVWEVIFTMAIIGIGLLLFALLIGNMQNFLQSLGRRRLERSLRSRNIEQWMSHRRLPEELRRQVREAERFSWAATRGINEEEHMVNLPEDLRRDIRRHLFKFVKKVRIFQLLDEPIIDAICERLRTKTYIKGSKILCQGGLLDKMVFIIRGKMQSIVEGHAAVPLSEGDVCGEELLTWCLEHPSADQEGRRIRFPGIRLLSNRLVECLTNVEAFVIRAADLEEVTNCFSRCMKIPRVQRAIRYESPYWRTLAARRIQLVWRYRRNRLNGVGTSELRSAA